MLGGVGLFGAVSAGLALVFGPSFSEPLLQNASALDAFFLGVGAGLLAYLVWWVYWLALMVVLWVRGIAPDTIVAASLVDPTDSGAVDSVVTGRHAAPAVPMKWRRRGKDPLVPGALPVMFAYMTAGMAGTLVFGTASKHDMAVAGLKVVVPLLSASGVGCLVGRHRHGLDIFSGRTSP